MLIRELLIFICYASAVLSLPTKSTQNNEPAERSFRLPNNTMPLLYDLTVRSDIHRGDFIFDGLVRINVRVLEASDIITLHYRQLLIRNVNLLNVDLTMRQRNVPFRMFHDVEFLEIPSANLLMPNEELIVEVTYTGILRTDNTGFFRTSYTDPESNEIVWLATTHFKSIDARHALPCYDEIQFRAPFRVRIDHHHTYHALSNMPVMHYGASEEFMSTVFEQTPPMPTHLLSFTISNFDFVTDNNANVLKNVYAQPPAVARGEVNHALEFSDLVQRRLETKFGPYTLPKLDHIAIPNLSWSTEPNWGLISYRETLLLQVANEPDSALIARMIRIAHVQCHNYFGNLVSPVSWTYLWMNEGFASFYERIIVDGLNEGSNQRLPFVTELKDSVKAADVNNGLVALNLYVETPEEIEFKAYDVIVTHDKAAMILHMMMFAMTQTTFERGVRYFLDARANQSATPQDLHAGLQRSWNEDFPQSPINIDAVMRPWEELPGYPIVTVRREGTSLFFTQQGFRTLHNSLYSIPIAYATASSSDFDIVRLDFWLTTEEMEIAQSDATTPWVIGDWIVLNLRHYGYYVTNYDVELWNILIETMLTSIESINFESRGLLFADLNILIDNGHDISATILLRLAAALQNETSVSVWNRALNGLVTVTSRVRDTVLHEGQLRYLRHLMTPLYNSLLNDENFSQDLAQVVTFLSCYAGVQTCLDNELNRITVAMENNTLPAFPACSGFMSAGEDVWMHFWNVALFATSEDRDLLLNDMACSNNIELITTYINEALNVEHGFTSDERRNLLVRGIRRNFVGYNLSHDFFAEYHNIIHSEIMDAGEYLTTIASLSNSECEAEKVMVLTHLIPSSSPVHRDSINAILELNLQWHHRNFDELLEFYENF